MTQSSDRSRPRRLRSLRLSPSIITVSDQTFVSGCNFLTTALIARALGPEDFGWYTLVWIAVLFAVSLQLGIIVSPMMSIGPKQHHAEENRYFGVLVVHELVFCLFASLGIGATIEWISPPSGTSSLVPLAAAVAGGAYLAQDFTRRLLFTRLRSHVVLAIDGINQLTKLVLIVFLSYIHGLNIESTLWIVATGAVASTVFATPYVGVLRFDRTGFWSTSVRQWQSARWLAGTGLMQWATANSALVVAGGLLGPVAVGALRAALTIVGVLNICREAIENIIPQQAGQALGRDGLPGLRAVLLRTAAFGLLLGGFVVLALALYGSPMLGLVYGREFEQYGFVIAWLSLTFPFSLAILTLVCGFRALEQTLSVFAATTAAAVFNLSLMYPAVRAFGISGAIGVMIASDCIVSIILLYRIRVAFAEEKKKLGRQN